MLLVELTTSRALLSCFYLWKIGAHFVDAMSWFNGHASCSTQKTDSGRLGILGAGPLLKDKWVQHNHECLEHVKCTVKSIGALFERKSIVVWLVFVKQPIDLFAVVFNLIEQAWITRFLHALKISHDQPQGVIFNVVDEFSRRDTAVEL